MPTPEALSLAHLIRHAVDMSDEDCASEIDHFAAHRGAEETPEPRCRMEQFGDGSCDCPQCMRMRGAPTQTGNGDAGERDYLERAHAVLRDGHRRHLREPPGGKNLTLCEVDAIAAALRSSHREGAEAMRRDAALFIYGADVYGRLADRLADGIRALPIPE